MTGPKTHPLAGDRCNAPAVAPISVFLVDDHEIVRRGLRELLEAEPDLGLDLDEIFDLEHYTKHAHEIVSRLDALDG